MPEDSNWSLIPHPGSGLARNESAGRRIISEMVSGALDQVKSQKNALSHDILTAELWFQRGEAFYYGWNEPKNHEDAAKCYRAASEKGHLDATCNLGCLFTLGLGVEKDDAESFRLFEYAAQHGHALSLLNLSHHYALGVGVFADARLAEAYLYLGLGKNDPARSKFAHWWSSKICTEAKLGVTEKMRDYEYKYRPARERIEAFTTVYEVLSSHGAAIDPFDESGMAIDVLKASHEAILRKVRLVDFAYSQVGGQVLVLDAHDSLLTCGDVLDLVAFEANAKWVSNEGGRPAECILIQSANGDFRPPMTTPESKIVGVVGTSGIALGENVHDLPRTEKIVGSLYQRGLGVPHSDEEAVRWHADFSKRIKIGDYELCEPDFKQITIWAKSTGIAPTILLTSLLIDHETSAQAHNAAIDALPSYLRLPDDFLDEDCLMNGRIVNVSIYNLTLPVRLDEWVSGLAIETVSLFAKPDSTLKVGMDGGFFSPDLPKLKRLDCASLGICHLDLGRVSNLEKLWCGSNNLTILNLEPTAKLKELFCGHNQLSSISLNFNPNLLTLWCGSNPLTSLPLSNAPNLLHLNCDVTPIKALELAEVPKLQGLSCQVCQLTSLDLSHVPQLKNLACGGNQITKLTLVHVPELIFLDCAGNSMDELDIRPLRQLKKLRYNKKRTRLIQRPDQNF